MFECIFSPLLLFSTSIHPKTPSQYSSTPPMNAEYGPHLDTKVSNCRSINRLHSSIHPHTQFTCPKPKAEDTGLGTGRYSLVVKPTHPLLPKRWLTPSLYGCHIYTAPRHMFLIGEKRLIDEKHVSKRWAVWLTRRGMVQPLSSSKEWRIERMTSQAGCRPPHRIVAFHLQHPAPPFHG